MKILITGCTGQVGTALINLASKFDYKILPFSRQIWDMGKAPKNGKDIVLEFKPDLVINTAAFTNVDGAENKSVLAKNINSIAPKFLAKGCEKLGIPIFHISTDYVYDGFKQEPYIETDLTNPLNVYGHSKLAGELEIQSETENSLILRTSWVFSKTKKNFVTSILNLANSQDTIKVVNDEFGCPTSSDCIASSIFKIIPDYMKSKQNFSGIYHYAGMPAVSRYEFAKSIISSAKLTAFINIKPCSSKDYISEATRPKNTIISSKKITSTFDVESCKWEKELKRYFKSYKIF